MIKFLYIIILIISSTVVNANEITIISQNLSGGTGLHVRLIAKYLPKYLNQRVILKEVPGAAGITAANYLFNVAPRDGNTIGFITTVAFIEGLIGSDNIKFKIPEITYLAVAQDGRLEPFMIWKKVDQIEFIGGSEGSLQFSYFKIVNKLLKWNAREVTGYANLNLLRLAFERNEVTAMANNLVGTRSVTPHWLTDSTIQPILQWGNFNIRHPDFPNVPTLWESVDNIRDKQIVRFLELQNSLSRTYIAPPNIPIARTQQLRLAFENIFSDVGYIKEAGILGISKPLDLTTALSNIEQLTSEFSNNWYNDNEFK